MPSIDGSTVYDSSPVYDKFSEHDNQIKVSAASSEKDPLSRSLCCVFEYGEELGASAESCSFIVITVLTFRKTKVTGKRKSFLLTL